MEKPAVMVKADTRVFWISRDVDHLEMKKKDDLGIAIFFNFVNNFKDRDRKKKGKEINTETSFLIIKQVCV